jgi:hypothetical protein
MNCAVIVIAGGKRSALLDSRTMPTLLAQGFAETVVVGEYHGGPGYTYLHVPGLTNTTTDALVKRDVGTLATKSDWLLYLSDDHVVVKTGQLPEHWLDIGVPLRFCTNGTRIPLNMGLDPRDPNAPYCAGHAGLFSRRMIQLYPWTTQPHDRLWDLLSSRSLAAFGARIGSQIGWEVEDLEPQARPWL